MGMVEVQQGTRVGPGGTYSGSILEIFPERKWQTGLLGFKIASRVYTSPPPNTLTHTPKAAQTGWKGSSHKVMF